MIRRGVTIAAVLAAGSVIAGALYWAFLTTPESNALMLGASALLVLAFVAVVAITINSAVLIARDAPVGQAIAAASRGTGWFLIAVAPLLIVWWLVGRVDQWIAAHQGEVNAWFIAQFGWADITRLLQAQQWLSRWARWVFVPLACVSLLAALLTRESARQSLWLRRAWHWRTLLVATAAFVLLWALPWQLTAWRPELPPTWVEPAVAALRLSVVFVLGVIGASIMVSAAVRNAKP